MKTKKQNDTWNAEFYKKHSECQHKRGISIIHEFKLQGNEHVLDVGCGDGRITAEIAAQVSNGFVLGIDISPNMIATATESFGYIKNLTFQCIDATTFSSNKKFDIAVSNSAFHWIKDQTRTLKNIYNHLKPGGKLFIDMAALYKNPVSEICEQQKWATLLSCKEQTFFPQTVETFSNMLAQCGFNNIDVKHNVVGRKFQSKDDLFNWIFAWAPHLTGLPEEKAREFTREVVNSACHAQKEEPVIFETAGLHACATRPATK